MRRIVLSAYPIHILETYPNSYCPQLSLLCLRRGPEAVWFTYLWFPYLQHHLLPHLS